MRIFKNRPLALSACVFALFSVVWLRLAAREKLLLLGVVGGVLLLTLLLCCLRRKMGKFAACLSLCLLACSLSLASSYHFFNIRYAAWQTKNGSPSEAEATVVEYLSSTAYSATYRVELDKIDGEDCDARAMLECAFASTLQRGDRVRVRAVPRAFSVEERFDEESYRLSDGCMTVLVCDRADDCELIGRDTSDLLLKCAALNVRLSYQLRNTVGGDAGGLAAALLLGNRTWIPADTTLDFQRSGISHLLALSGLHVSILIGFLELVLRRLRLSKLLRALVIPLCAVGYLAVTGFAVSTARAVLMICVLYLAFLFRATYDPLTALCTVLAVILSVTPYAVLDLSLWMSFLAAASILIFMPAVVRLTRAWSMRSRLPRPIKRAVCAILNATATGVVANLALMLLSASVFGEFSLLSVPATLVLSIPVTLLLELSAVLLFLPFLPVLPWACSLVGDIILSVAAMGSEIENVLLPVRAPMSQAWIVLLTIALILLAVLPLRSRWWAVPVPTMLILVVVSSVVATQGMEPSVYTFKTGRGVVRLYTEAGHAVVVNDTSGAASASYEIKAAATDEHCTEIDDLILSRYYNQATYFIAKVSERSRVRMLHMPTPADDRERAIAARLEAEAALHGIPVMYDAEAMLERYDTAKKP